MSTPDWNIRTAYIRRSCPNISTNENRVVYIALFPRKQQVVPDPATSIILDKEYSWHCCLQLYSGIPHLTRVCLLLDSSFAMCDCALHWCYPRLRPLCWKSTLKSGTLSPQLLQIEVNICLRTPESNNSRYLNV